MNIVRVKEKSYWNGFYSPPPKLVGSALYIADFPTSAVVSRHDLVACNILGESVQWWFFVLREGSVIETTWEKLTDEQQLWVRVAIIEGDNGRSISYNPDNFPYNNDNCYALEVLEQL